MDNGHAPSEDEILARFEVEMAETLAKIVPLDDDIAPLVRRSSAVVRQELFAASDALRAELRLLAKRYPHVFGVGCIAFGELKGAFVAAPYAGGWAYSCTARQRVRTLGRQLACLPEDLLATFEAAFAATKADRIKEGEIDG